jgi:hypothetical protein
MASIRSLISKRGENRTATTKLIQAINATIADAAIPRDRKIHLLTKKLEDLHTKLKHMEKLDTEIVDNLADADIETDITDAQTVNFTNQEARDEAEYELQKLIDERDADIAAAAAAAALANPQQLPPANLNPTINVTTATDSSHLPKFNLPDFNGNILMWNAFWDVFEVEVHQKTKYSNATKFNFLNSRLSGEAKASTRPGTEQPQLHCSS